MYIDKPKTMQLRFWLCCWNRIVQNHHRIWCVSDTVCGNEAKIRKYIQEQEFNDQMCDQLSFKEYEDPFKNVADFDDDDSPEVPTDSICSVSAPPELRWFAAFIILS